MSSSQQILTQENPQSAKKLVRPKKKTKVQPKLTKTKRRKRKKVAPW